MSYEEIISRVSDSLGLSKRLVDKTYKAYWRSIREHIVALPLKQKLPDEEFLKLRPNVNIPSIGKLTVTLDRYHGMNKRLEIQHEYFKNLKKDNNVEDREN